MFSFFNFFKDLVCLLYFYECVRTILINTNFKSRRAQAETGTLALRSKGKIKIYVPIIILFRWWICEATSPHKTYGLLRLIHMHGWPLVCSYTQTWQDKILKCFYHYIVSISFCFIRLTIFRLLKVKFFNALNIETNNRYYLVF